MTKCARCNENAVASLETQLSIIPYCDPHLRYWSAIGSGKVRMIRNR